MGGERCDLGTLSCNTRSGQQDVSGKRARSLPLRNGGAAARAEASLTARAKRARRLLSRTRERTNVHGECTHVLNSTRIHTHFREHIHSYTQSHTFTHTPPQSTHTHTETHIHTQTTQKTHKTQHQHTHQHTHQHKRTHPPPPPHTNTHHQHTPTNIPTQEHTQVVEFVALCKSSWRGSAEHPQL